MIRTIAQRAQADADQAAAITRALRLSDPATPSGATRARSAAADPQRLRNIPAIGRNVTGAIPGTNPEAAAVYGRRGTIR